MKKVKSVPRIFLCVPLLFLVEKATHFCPKGSLPALRRDLLALMVDCPGASSKKPRLVLGDKQAGLVDAVEACLALHTKTGTTSIVAAAGDDSSVEDIEIAAKDVGESCMLARRATSIRKTFSAPTLEGIVAELKKCVEPKVLLLCRAIAKVVRRNVLVTVDVHLRCAGFLLQKSLEVLTTAHKPHRRQRGQLKPLTCWNAS